MNDATIKFVVPDENAEQMKLILKQVYASLVEKGYNPINQIVGYLLSEDHAGRHRRRRGFRRAGPALPVRRILPKSSITEAARPP